MIRVGKQKTCKLISDLVMIFSYLNDIMKSWTMTNQCLENSALMYSIRYPLGMISVQHHKTSALNIGKKIIFDATHKVTTWRLTVLSLATIKSALNGYQQITVGETTNHSRRSASTAPEITRHCLKTIQQQQSEINRSVSSSAPSSVYHRFAPTHVNLNSKKSFANVVKKLFKNTNLRRMMFLRIYEHYGC